MNDLPVPLSDDFLIRLFHGDIVAHPAEVTAGAAAHETQSVMHARHLSDTQLLELARDIGTVSTLEALVARVSRGSLDWAALKTEVVAHGERPRTHEPTLDRLSLVGLWNVACAAMATTGDAEATRALSAFVAHRVLAGGDFPDDQLEQLAAMLLQTDQARLARRFARRLSADTWARHVVGAELEQPRFQGSRSAVLAAMNQAYRSDGLEPVVMDTAATTAWEGLNSPPVNPAPSGPVVSIILVTSSGASALPVAVQSVIAQSYQDWELLLIEDGSDDADAGFLDAVAARDSRIRLIRHRLQQGETARREQAVRDDARGEYITFLSDRAWAHPRRVELQVRDLESHPTGKGNVVNAAWVSEDLSFVQGPTIEPFLEESSLMISRRAASSARGGDAKLIRPDVALQWQQPPSAAAATIPAPDALHVDMLVIADFVGAPSNTTFASRIAEEIRQATASGLSVGVLHRDGITRHDDHKRTDQLESLVTADGAVLVHADWPVTADLVVARHAGVAQWRAATRSPISARRVIVVDDPSSGDVRAETFSQPDVLQSVEGWFGLTPAWLRVTPIAATIPSAHRLAPTHKRPDRAADSPVLSIVMPVYNVAPYLEAALLSVLYQEFQDFELIAIDDASTDGSRQILEMYAALDPRLRVITLDLNTLGGAGIPSNLGIRAARGRYLGFVDSDDIVTRGSFARLIALAEQSEADLVIGGFTTFTDKDRVVSASYDLPRIASIPRGKVINAVTHPELIGMSPVPWRKLYRTAFLDEFAIEYPEGDYFFEDNPLHWSVLTFAERIVLTDDLVSSHRLGRSGQTATSAEYKKGAYAHHFATALRALLATGGSRRDVLLSAFIERLYASRWVVRQQTQVAAKAMVAKRFAALFDRAVAAGARVTPAIQPTVDSYRATYPLSDLTVVIATHNCVNQIRRTLDSVVAVTGMNVDVLLVDDGSTDGTLSLLRTLESSHSNVHVFEQGQRGIGRARNSVIPLITGRFTFFLDAGDVIDPRALTAAVREADSQDLDLVFTRDAVAGADDEAETGGLLDDGPTWEQLNDAPTQEERQSLAAALDGYAWNRLIKTDLLQDSNIFFGATSAYEDVPFHWQSIALAERIGFAPVTVVSRKKFTTRRHATNVTNATAVEATEALRYTHERIESLPRFHVLREQWMLFARDLL